MSFSRVGTFAACHDFMSSYDQNDQYTHRIWVPSLSMFYSMLAILRVFDLRLQEVVLDLRLIFA